VTITNTKSQEKINDNPGPGFYNPKIEVVQKNPPYTKFSQSGMASRTVTNAMYNTAHSSNDRTGTDSGFPKRMGDKSTHGTTTTRNT
jgi:hypothetical protein